MELFWRQRKGVSKLASVWIEPFRWTMEKWNSAYTNPSTYKMGVYKYIGELYKKKAIRCPSFPASCLVYRRSTCCLTFTDCRYEIVAGEYRQLNVIHRASRPSHPDKAHRLGYKVKQGYVVYRVRVRRGNRKKHVPKGACEPF